MKRSGPKVSSLKPEIHELPMEQPISSLKQEIKLAVLTKKKNSHSDHLERNTSTAREARKTYVP